MKCPHGDHEYTPFFQGDTYWCAICHFHAPEVAYIWNNQDPNQGYLIAINDKTHSATILTDDKNKIRTKNWWFPKAVEGVQQ